MAPAYELILQGKMRQARTLLQEALTADLENNDIIFAAQACSFWMDTMEHLSELDSFEQGETLLNQWKVFLVLVDRQKLPVLGKTIYTFKKTIFSTALEQYSKVFEDMDSKFHAEVCRKMGYCQKKLGSYEVALNYLIEANNAMQGQANILAEMADCYDLCGQDKIAKVIFREAFFIAPERVDLSYLDSPLINKLVEKVAEKGYSNMELQEWLPVYGVLYKVFDVRRTLKSQEIGRLKQDVYAKENELKDPANNSALLTPRLINMYFWLIDHYDLSQDNTSKIQEVLLKIKILDKNIYSLYVGEL